MFRNSLIQHFNARVILTSAVLASTTASVSAAVSGDTAILISTASTSARLTSVQLAQSAAIVYPTLQVGSMGETVSRLQSTLALLGFYQGNVDGTYGESTQQAVIAFQTAANLTADGIAGPATWRRLLPTPDEMSAADSTSNEDTTGVEALTETAPTQTGSEPAASSLPILRPSAEGPAVSQLQKNLQTLGYYSGAIDGSYGDLTEAAVREFQADRQLLVDAVVGPATWDALSRALQD